MRILRIFSMLFVTAVILPTFSTPLALAADRPLIKIQEPTHDFGTVKRGEVLTHKFVFTNEGSGVLRIIDFILS